MLVNYLGTTYLFVYSKVLPVQWKGKGRRRFEEGDGLCIVCPDRAFPCLNDVYLPMYKLCSL